MKYPTNLNTKRLEVLSKILNNQGDIEIPKSKQLKVENVNLLECVEQEDCLEDREEDRGIGGVQCAQQ